ncbi:2-hydroxyisoflavanone dehydratase-like [Andrographis paniculata]|uniref:2-hydroxyisoflavanone dehydratase-like n=1 Tax=Andrographis paniculata TaxID=175694 RepID=UPI0021E82991|nr:2-hydroxyisoflavanone dehydratase-like [Andrographis paniculata]
MYLVIRAQMDLFLHFNNAMFGCKCNNVFLLVSILLLPQTTPSPNPTILYDIYPFIRVYTNGTIQRFIGQDFSPPNDDPLSAVRSKDIQISPNPNLISARLYLPRPPHPSHRFPLLIYFHGGGFFTESAFSNTYHTHLTSLASKSKVLAVSVNYRLAPEHPLPTAYQDAWRALKWSLRHAAGINGTEPWLTRHADFNRVYLGGDSVGANIAHRMSLLIGEGYSGVRVAGMFLNCPYFLGSRAVGNELASEYSYVAEQMKKLWRYAYPNSTGGLDDPLVNPGMDRGLRGVGCGKVLVYVAGNDWLKYRGWYYKGALSRSGWVGEIKVVEVGGESHVFNLINPRTPKALAMLTALANFLNARW